MKFHLQTRVGSGAGGRWSRGLGGPWSRDLAAPDTVYWTERKTQRTCMFSSCLFQLMFHLTERFCKFIQFFCRVLLFHKRAHYRLHPLTILFVQLLSLNQQRFCSCRNSHSRINTNSSCCCSFLSNYRKNRMSHYITKHSTGL